MAVNIFDGIKGALHSKLAKNRYTFITVQIRYDKIDFLEMIFMNLRRVIDISPLSLKIVTSPPLKRYLPYPTLSSVFLINIQSARKKQPKRRDDCRILAKNKGTIISFNINMIIRSAQMAIAKKQWQQQTACRQAQMAEHNTSNKIILC